ncbi:unnamed protein product [Didymodactylos carnosus]|uniref:Uncharacterized protein n=1 Tax=Didymodactylos carnosus TaxID=1234261 RepID=A0A813R7K5_9BILA|nr:unnamed protein product [Didymodactylos carnosus]CAF3561020.1 unnamed protein product [Didymodactylos carnosus]
MPSTMNNGGRNERKRPISQRTSLPPAKRFSTVISSSNSSLRHQTRSNDQKSETTKSTTTSKENSRKPLSPSSNYLRRSERHETSSSSTYSKDKTKYSSSSHDRYSKSGSKLDSRSGRVSRRRTSRSSSSSRSPSSERRGRTIRNALPPSKTTFETKKTDNEFSSLVSSKEICTTRSSTLRPLNDSQQQKQTSEMKPMQSAKIDTPTTSVSSENSGKKMIVTDKPYKKPTVQPPCQAQQSVVVKKPPSTAIVVPCPPPPPPHQALTPKKEETISRPITLVKPPEIKTEEKKIVSMQPSVQQRNSIKLSPSESKCSKFPDDKDKTISITVANKEEKNDNSKSCRSLVDYACESEDESDKHKQQRQSEKRIDKPSSTDCNNNSDLLKKRSTDNVIIQPLNMNLEDKKLAKKINLKVLKLTSPTSSSTTTTTNNIKMLTSDDVFSSALRVPTKIKLTKTIEQQEDSNNIAALERKKLISYALPDSLNNTSLNTTYECEKEECLSIKKDENDLKTAELDDCISIGSDTSLSTSATIQQTTKTTILQLEDNNAQIPLSPPSSIKSPLTKHESSTPTHVDEKSNESQDLITSSTDQETGKISSVVTTSPPIVDDKPQDNFMIPPTMELSPNSLSSSPDLSSYSSSDDEFKAINSYKRRYRSLSSSLAAFFDCRSSLPSTPSVKSKSLTRIEPPLSLIKFTAKQDETVCEYQKQEQQKLLKEKKPNKTKVLNGKVSKTTKRQYKKKHTVSVIEQQTQLNKDTDEERCTIIKELMDQLIHSTEMQMINSLSGERLSTVNDENQSEMSLDCSTEPLSSKFQQPPLAGNESFELLSNIVNNTINSSDNVETTKSAQCNNDYPTKFHQDHSIELSPSVQPISSGPQPVVLTEIQLDELAYLLHANVHRSDIEKIGDTNKVEERMRDLWRSMSITKKKAYYTRVLNLHKRPNRGVVVVPADEIGNSTTPILQPPTVTFSSSAITPPLSSTPTLMINPFTSTHHSPSPLLFQSVSTPINHELEVSMQKNDKLSIQKQHTQEQFIEITPPTVYISPQLSKSAIFKDIVDELIKGSKGLDKLCQPSSVLNSVQQFIQSSQEKQIDTVKKLEKDAEKKCTIQFNRALLFSTQRTTYFLTKHSLSSSAIMEYKNEIERLVKYYYLLVLSFNFRRQEKEFENTLGALMTGKITFTETLRSSMITDLLSELAYNPLLSHDFLSSQPIVIDSTEYSLPSIHNIEFECEIIEQIKNDNAVTATIPLLDLDEVTDLLSRCERTFSMAHSNMNPCASYCSVCPPQQAMFNHQYHQPIPHQQYGNNICYFTSPSLPTLNHPINYFESPYISAYEPTHPSYYNPSPYADAQYSVIQQSQQQQQYSFQQQQPFDRYYVSSSASRQSPHHNPFHHSQQQQQYHHQLETDAYRRAVSMNRKYAYSNNPQQEQLVGTTVASSATSQTTITPATQVYDTNSSRT